VPGHDGAEGDGVIGIEGHGVHVVDAGEEGRMVQGHDCRCGRLGRKHAVQPRQLTVVEPSARFAHS
jgi:hypothetical protein